MDARHERERRREIDARVTVLAERVAGFGYPDPGGFLWWEERDEHCEERITIEPLG